MTGLEDTDAEVAAIAGGDSQAFARWLARAEPPLRRSLRRFAAVADTEAILQETLLRVWQVAASCTPDGRAHALMRLGMRIAKNLAISAARRHRLEPIPVGELPEAELEPAGLPDDAVRRAVASCRDKLPPQPAQAITARLDDDGLRSDHELAAALGMRTNTFLQNVTRARRLLAECLRAAGIDLQLEMA